MKLTAEQIEQGLRDLELSDDKARETLWALARISQPDVRQSPETITAAHTSLEPTEQADAKLESGT